MVRIILLLFTAILSILALNCPENFDENEETGRCYRRSPTAFTMSFGGAKSFCENKYNAKMISIHSVQESNAIKKVFGSDEMTSIYLGLKKVDGAWQWADDTPLDYTNWQDVVEPSEEGKDCAIITDKTTMEWKAIACHRGWIYTAAMCYA